VGTPLYMSPEVLRGEGHAFASDVWSLGCMLYELAMLRSPFEERSLTLDRLFAKIVKGQYAPVPVLRSVSQSVRHARPNATHAMHAGPATARSYRPRQRA
jgi:serine/threonine protein kinase